jgi:acetyl esterase
VSFNTPSKHYNKLAHVPDEIIEKILSESAVTYGPIDLRFTLYVKSRQEGTWIKNLCKKEDLLKYALDDEKLKSLPPPILAAATLDPDVPYKMSKKLSRLIPNSRLITIYEEIHDFDRDINKDTGILIYDEILKWLGERI